MNVQFQRKHNIGTLQVLTYLLENQKSSVLLIFFYSQMSFFVGHFSTQGLAVSSYHLRRSRSALPDHSSLHCFQRFRQDDPPVVFPVSGRIRLRADGPNSLGNCRANVEALRDVALPGLDEIQRQAKDTAARLTTAAQQLMEGREMTDA